MRILPLIYIEHFTEQERLQHECSDRIWLSRHQFEQMMSRAEPGVAQMLELINGVEQKIIGSLFGYHHNEDSQLVYLPQWMYDELCHEDEHITVSLTHPGLCTGIMIQPHTSDHVKEEDPQEILRQAFEQYGCLTPGTTIPIWMSSTQKHMDVTIMEVRPNNGETRSIRNSEIELELMPPLDMPLPPPPRDPRPQEEEDAEAETAPTYVPASPFANAGAGQRVGSSTADDGLSLRERMAEAAKRRLKAAQETTTNDLDTK